MTNTETRSIADTVAADDLDPDGPREIAAPPPTVDRSTRRRVLGALALGFAAAACSKSEDALGSAPPQSQSTLVPPSTAAGQPSPQPATVPLRVDTASAPLEPTATGRELDQIKLPVADPSAVAAPAAPAAGDGSAAATDSAAAVDPASGSNAAPAGESSTDSTSAPTTTTTASTSSTSTKSEPGVLVVDVDEGEIDPDETSTTTAAPATDSTDAPAPTDPPGPATPAAAAAAPVLLANRITFGVTPQVLGQIDSMGVDGYIEDQLTKTGPDNAVEGRFGQFKMLNRDLLSKAGFDSYKNSRNDFRKEITFSTLLRATSSRNQLFEMMTALWTDHFNVGILGDGTIEHMLADYQENVIRPHALGNFRDLLKATAESPAMLVYLDNDSSNANDDQGLNENYGRELLELHTLGIDENGEHVYSEDDVRAAAMAMTGWSTVGNRNDAKFSQFEFKDNYQYTGEISLLDGAWTRGNTTGKATGDSLLEFLATHPSTARYVAYKIARRFVSDTPPAALVDAAAEVYLQNDTALVPTVRHILRSDEFAASAGQKMRRPFEHVVAALRALGAELPNNPLGGGATTVRNAIGAMGNDIWSWPEPDGYPDMAADWLSTNGVSSRWSLCARIARNRVDNFTVDLGALRPANGTVSDFILGLGERFGLGQRTAEEVAAIATAAGLSPADPVGSVNDDQTSDVAALLLAHPIFQTR